MSVRVVGVLLSAVAATTSCAIFSVRLPCAADKDCPDGQACAADKLCATLVERGEGEGASEGEGAGAGEGEGEGPVITGTNAVFGNVADGFAFILRVSATNFATVCTDSCATDTLGSCTPTWSPNPITVAAHDDGSRSIENLPDGTWAVFMDIPSQTGAFDVNTSVQFVDGAGTKPLGSFTYAGRVDSYVVDVVNGRFQNAEDTCDVEVDGIPENQSVLCTQADDGSGTPPPNTFANCLEHST